MSLDILKLGAGVEVEADKDVIGGGSAVLASGVYPIQCEYLYLDQTKSGALMAYGSFKPEGGRSIRFSECVMSKKSGAAKVTYTDKKTGKEVPLPGYSKLLHLFHACDIDIADLSEMEVEKKTLKLWDYEAKKELPVEKNVLVQMTGQHLQAGIRKVLETKMAQDANGDWNVPTAEEKTFNDIFKWFNKDGFTVQEVKEQAAEPAFKNQWEEAYKDKDLDRRVKNAPKAGAPKLGGQAPQGAGQTAPAGLSFD